MKNNIIDLPTADTKEPLAYNKPPEVLSSFNKIVKPESLKLIEMTAQKIMPLTVIAATLEVHIQAFMTALKVSHEIQGAIIKGETHTFDKEWNIYTAFLSHWEMGKPLKDASGNTITPTKVTPMHVGLRMRHWEIFFKRFYDFSFTVKANEYSIKDDRAEESPDYMNLREQVMKRINVLTGIEHNIKKQATFEPTHYAHSMLLKGKGKVSKDGKIVLQNPMKKDND